MSHDNEVICASIFSTGATWVRTHGSTAGMLASSLFSASSIFVSVRTAGFTRILCESDPKADKYSATKSLQTGTDKLFAVVVLKRPLDPDACAGRVSRSSFTRAAFIVLCSGTAWLTVVSCYVCGLPLKS